MKIRNSKFEIRNRLESRVGFPYNHPMDDNHRPDEPIERLPVEEPEETPQPKPLKVPSDVPMVPVTRMRKGKEPWKQGSGCGNRVAGYGCALGVVVLIGILMAGASMLRKGVWTTMEKGRRAVVQSLPVGMPEAERRRTTQNLDRFRRVLEELDDPYPVMGQFMKRVRAGLADGRLTKEEVEEMNFFLETVIEDSGIPPMQLGQKMRNEELGIRNAALPPEQSMRWRAQHQLEPHCRPRILAEWLWCDGNSEFRIPNSEFSAV